MAHVVGPWRCRVYEIERRLEHGARSPLAWARARTKKSLKPAAHSPAQTGGTAATTDAHKTVLSRFAPNSLHSSQTLRVTGHPFLGLACARHRYEFEIDGGRGVTHWWRITCAPRLRLRVAATEGGS